MRDISLGQIVFGLTLVALGSLSLFSGDFAFVWQPVPAGIPGRALLACLSGAVMCVAGAGLLVPRTSALAAFVLTVYTLIWLLVLHVPHLIAAPMHEVNWGGCGEIALLVSASWILYACSTAPWHKFYFIALTSEKAIRAARVLFALSVPFIGLEHLVYSDVTASMVPAWLPYRMGWAYFTGLAHIAAGLAILFSIWPRLAAALETLMMGVFTVLVWIPAVLAAPSQRFGWTALLISAVMTAAGWVITDSYRGASWFSSRQPSDQLARLAMR
jgi:uncharacterized membrane protein